MIYKFNGKQYSIQITKYSEKIKSPQNTLNTRKCEQVLHKQNEIEFRFK